MWSILWPDGVVRCPRCGSENVCFARAQDLEVQGEARKAAISAKVGTVLEDSPIALGKWLSAFWLIANAKNGISSYELHRSIGVTQKTAWFMLHRIRLAMQDGSIEKFSGKIEADETFIGGRARNMHADKRAKTRSLQKGRGYIGKVAVMGLLERNSPERASRIKLRVVRNSRRAELHKHTKKRSGGRLRNFYGCAAFVHRIGTGINSQRNRWCRVLREGICPHKRTGKLL